MIHKFTSLNVCNEITNQNSIKVPKFLRPTTLGTSLINSPMSPPSMINFYLSISKMARTCLSMIAAFMMSLQFLSTVVNLRPSSGICDMMSGELKIGSKQSQVPCTFNHSSMISCRKKMYKFISFILNLFFDLQCIIEYQQLLPQSLVE